MKKKIVLLPIFLLSLLILILYGKELSSDRLKHRVIENLQSLTGEDISVDDLSIHAFPPAVQIENLTAGDEDKGLF